MFTVESLIAGPFAATQTIVGDQLRCAFLQTDGRSEYQPASLTLMLDEAVEATSVVSTDLWPQAIADYLNAALQRTTDDLSLPTNALFAAAALTPRAVHVCTAGDLRIVLVVDGAPVSVTRDHVYVEDPPESPLATSLPSAVAASLATRWLGVGSTRSPECLAWRVDGPYGIIVSSSECHQRRPSEKRLLGAIQDGLESVFVDPGLLVGVEYIPEGCSSGRPLRTRRR